MAQIDYLTRVHFSFGARELIPDELTRIGIARPLIVTDDGVIKAGLVDDVLASAPRLAEAALYSETLPNPTEAQARELAARFVSEDADGLVAIGGGSSIDLAKAAVLAAHHDRPLRDYAAIEAAPASIGDIAPILAVPTTAGSGSEVGRATVIVMADGVKRAVVSPKLVPAAAICDPELTLSAPPALTAGCGMDAISHCVEAFLSPRVNPPADAIARDGLARAVASIERAVGESGDQDARWEMMMASLEGGLVFQKGLGAVHAMSHPLGALNTPALHHGTVNGLLLPHALRFNAPFCGEKLTALVSMLGLRESTDLPEFFTALNARLGLPECLCAMGVASYVLPGLAAQAAADFSNRTNPRSANETDYLALYHAAS